MTLKQTALVATILAIPGLCAVAGTDRTPDVDRRGPSIRNVTIEAAGKARFLQANPGTSFAENDGRIERVFGRAFGGGANAIDAAASFVRDNAKDLWGVEAEQFLPIGPWGEGLHALPLMPDPVTAEPKFILLGYIPHVGNLPVYDSALRVLVRNEPGFPVVLASAQVPEVGGFAAEAPVMIDEDAASAQARLRFADAEISGTRSVVFAGTDGVTEPARVGVEFILEGTDTLGEYMKYRFIADPVTGEIIFEQNQVLHADVQVTVMANKTDQFSMECGPESASPLPHARVTVGGSVYTADRNGVVTIPNGSGSVTVNAESRTRWFNCDGGQEDVSTTIPDGGSGMITINQSNSNDTSRARSNAVYFAEEVRNFTLDQMPNFPTIGTQQNFTINTGVSGSCNAFYNGSSINFYNAGGGCANTTFDVIVHHEYGHHLVDRAGSGQGQYGEGAGDSVGVLITGDPRLAVGFYQNQCSSGIRNADNNCTFSASGCSSCGSAIHTCGQLLSGMVWEVREQLIAAGKPVGIIDSLFINSMPLHNGTSINSNITIDWLTLDDDNGNINDGTPNYIQINAGCTIKGVPGPDLDFIAFEFPGGLPDSVDPNGGATFQVDVTAVSIDPIPGSGRLFYRVDGGSFTSVAMQGSGNSYTATLPAAECESIVDFYVTAQADGGSTFSSPANAPGTAYSALSATDLIVAYENDFELSSIGWDVVNDAGLTAGAWERANPSGTRTRGEADPAFDGSFCFVTENGSGNFDIDDGCTTLISPSFDATSAGTTVSYARWWSNDGDGAGADPNNEIFFVDISDDNGASWVSLEQVGPVNQSTGNWYEVSFLVSDFVDNTDSVRVRFRACDLGTPSISEAGIDAFRVESVECEDTPPSLPGDLNGDCEVNGADLGLLVAAWGSGSGPADLDGNGTVEGGDLGIMLAYFGTSCP
ncbi:MAG: hypothetical protein VX726_06540 [Planctomycetota bacterium]|nr:hypothetical protein [Planctomycetota bacterium]